MYRREPLTALINAINTDGLDQNDSVEEARLDAPSPGCLSRMAIAARRVTGSGLAYGDFLTGCGFLIEQKQPGIIWLAGGQAGPSLSAANYMHVDHQIGGANLPKCSAIMVVFGGAWIACSHGAMHGALELEGLNN